MTGNLIKGFITATILIFAVFYFLKNTRIVSTPDIDTPVEANNSTLLTGIVRSSETMDSIFDKHNLNKSELSEIYLSAKDAYDLSRISVGSVYSFELDKQNSIQSMRYGINELSFLNVVRDSSGFSAQKVDIQLKKRIGSLYITIRDNLIYSMPGTHSEYHRLALDLSDIYSWDIDFFTDIRNGDSVKIIVEELWAGEVFRGYGNILASEFINDGKLYSAYRFEHDGYSDYYDSDGKSLRKTLLKSPLRFSYISSRFSNRRFHPVLRTYRPHLGVDYAAPYGTPVSASGSGKVIFAAYKGQNGKMVRIRHSGGYETYYGHLSKIPKKIRKGVKVSQGDIIGYVGSTGLSTGPHLDYRVKRNGKFINPLKMKLPRNKSIPGSKMAEFDKTVFSLGSRLSLLTRPVIANSAKNKTSS